MRLTTRAFAAAVLLASAAVLGAALLSQYWGGLRPCELCLWQRWPWAAAITIALLALFGGGRGALPWLALALAAVFAIGIGLASYHVGVEQRWFAGPTACTASAAKPTTLEELKRQLSATAPVLCDKVQWSLFGVSLAGWNLVASLGMAAVCGVVFAQTRRRASLGTAQA